MKIKLENKKIKNKLIYSNKYLKDLRTTHENIHAFSSSSGLSWVDTPNELVKRGLSIIREKSKEYKGCSGVLILADNEEYLTLRAILDVLKDCIKKEVVLISAYFSVKEIETQLKKLDNKTIQFFVISKDMDSENMLEAFRILENYMIKKYKKADEYKTRITAITDYEKGKLKTIASEEKYDIVVYPRVTNSKNCAFTSAVLLPLYVLGVDVDSFILGAKEGFLKCFNFDLDSNPAYRFAVIYNLLCLKKFKTNEFIIASPNKFLTSLTLVVKNLICKNNKNKIKFTLFNIDESCLCKNDFILKEKNESALFVLSKEIQNEELQKLDKINLENNLTDFANFKKSFAEIFEFNLDENIEKDLGEIFYILYMINYVI